MSGSGRSSRRQERVFAFKVLYGLCFSGAESLEKLQDSFLQSPDKPEGQTNTIGFAWDLVKGVWQNQEELDSIIGSFSENWRLERMGKVELTLLRLAVFELVKQNEAPPKVILNEAIELSKQFGDDRSRGFVNGILDTAAKAVESGKFIRP